MRVRGWMRVAQYGFTAIGIAALAYCADVWLTARHYQASQESYFERKLEHANRAAIPHRVPPALSVPEDGGLVGRLQIPRIGLSVMVVEGVNSGDLKRAVGHIPGTALPGERGNVGLAGHRDTFFRPLAGIQQGDTINMETLEGVYRYRVMSTKIVKPGDVAVLYPTGQDSLTLVTCFPFHYVGSAPFRFIVRAEPLAPAPVAGG
jgi:sortase A